MNWKELFKPTILKIIIFSILILTWVYLPAIPIKNHIQCITSPCNPITKIVSLYQLIFKDILASNYLFTTPSTFIVPIFELVFLYILAAIISLVIINKKSKLANISIIITGFLALISKFTCLINHSEYSCRNDYLTLFVSALGVIAIIYGLYRFIKYR